MTTTDEAPPVDFDSLYSEIVSFVANARYPSCSLIQKKFKLSFSAVKKIIEKMDESGITHGIGKHDAPKSLNIKIVLIGNANSREIKKIIEKKTPGVEFIILDVDCP